MANRVKLFPFILSLYPSTSHSDVVSPSFFPISLPLQLLHSCSFIFSQSSQFVFSFPLLLSAVVPDPSALEKCDRLVDSCGGFDLAIGLKALNSSFIPPLLFKTKLETCYYS